MQEKIKQFEEEANGRENVVVHVCQPYGATS